MAKKDGHSTLYLATDHIGFYEKYGFEYESTVEYVIASIKIIDPDYEPDFNVIIDSESLAKVVYEYPSLASDQNIIDKIMVLRKLEKCHTGIEKCLQKKHINQDLSM